MPSQIRDSNSTNEGHSYPISLRSNDLSSMVEQHNSPHCTTLAMMNQTDLVADEISHNDFANDNIKSGLALNLTDRNLVCNTADYTVDLHKKAHVWWNRFVALHFRRYIHFFVLFVLYYGTFSLQSIRFLAFSRYCWWILMQVP